MVPAARLEARVEMPVQCRDSGRVQVVVVGEEDMAMRVPAVLVSPGDLEGDDVPGDAEASP